MLRAAPAMPTASNAPARRSCASVGMRVNSNERSPAPAALSRVSVAPAKSSPYQARRGVAGEVFTLLAEEFQRALQLRHPGRGFLQGAPAVQRCPGLADA